MTSNLGSDLILDSANNPELQAKLKDQLHDLLHRTFRPEFLNRIDETVMFQQLDKSCIESIIKLQLERVQKRLEDRKISLEFDQSALEFLGQVGYDPAMGARPVKRAIQTYVENSLAKELLSGNISEGSRVMVSSKDGQLSFVVQN